MKLSDWARKHGVSYKTAWKWWRAGILPVRARQLPTGTILVEEEAAPEARGEVVVYARVSSADQKGDLDRQVARLVEWATERGLPVSRVVREVGSGLDGRRRRLRAVLADPRAAVIVVETRDRLVRWGFELLEAALAAQGRRIVAVEDREVEDDLARDVLDVLTSFCGRTGSRRSARRRARRALESLGCG
jgi:predicted site-specific integrase-resolvase